MMFKCGICGKQFKIKKAIEKHFFIEHYSIIQDEKDILEDLQEIEDLHKK